MAACQYTLKVQNATDQPFHFAVYQKFKFNQRIQSVAWKVINLAPHASNNMITEKEICWSEVYSVCTANYEANETKFIPNQVLQADMRRCYKIVSLNNTANISEDYTQEDSQHIVLQNNTTKPLNLGFVLDKTLIGVEKDVVGQEKVSYPMNSTYYVACYHDIEVGQPVSEGAVIGPVKLTFELGSSTHVLQACKHPSGVYSLRHHGNESNIFVDETDNSTIYKLTLQNLTERAWHFGVFQHCPGLTSVAWKVCGLPPALSEEPSTDVVKWRVDFGVCILRHDSDKQKYVKKQFKPADLNNVYEVISIEDIPSISTDPPKMSKTEHDVIMIKNCMGPPAKTLSVGFTVNSDIIAIDNRLDGHQGATFKTSNSYQVACFHNLAPGHLVNEGIALGPVEVKYDDGVTKATVEVCKDLAGSFQMKVTYY